MAVLSSFRKTADTQIFVGPGVLKSFIVHTDGAADATLKLYDVEVFTDAADANEVCEFDVLGASKNSGRNYGEEGLAINNGLWADITGAGAFYFIEYKIKARV